MADQGFDLDALAADPRLAELLDRPAPEVDPAQLAALAAPVEGYQANLERARTLEAQRQPARPGDVQAAQNDLALRQARDASLRSAAGLAASPDELREVMLLAPPNLQVELATAALATVPDKASLGQMLGQLLLDDGRKLAGTQARLQLRALADGAKLSDPAAARARVARGISVDQAKTDPTARAALQTLARSGDPADKAAMEKLARGWEQALIERRLGQGAQGKTSDQVFQDVQADIDALAGAVGFDVKSATSLPASYRDAALDLVDKGLTLDQIRANPAMGQLLGQLQFDADPAVRQKLDGAVRKLLGQGLDPKLGPDEAIARFNQQAAELGRLTGLGPQVAAQSQAAVQDKARQLLATNPSLSDLEANPAMGALLSSLQGTPDGDKLKAALQRWSDQALDRELKDAHGEDAVKKALANYQSTMKGLAERSHIGGLADVIQKTMDGHKDTLEHKANEGKGWLDKIGDFFGSIGHFVSDCIKDLGHLAGEVVHGVEAGVSWVGHEIKEGAKWVGHELYDHVIDPALTKEIGKDVDRGEATGNLGHLLTNRLDIGHSAYVHIQAGGKFGPFELAGGGELEIKRVPKTDPATGKIQYEADGTTPQTEIQITLVAGAKAGVGVDVGHQGPGVDFRVKAEAGAKVNGVAQFRFDAKNPQDVSDMTSLFKDVGESAMESAIPGIGIILAAHTAEKLPDDFKRFTSHLSEYSGQIDVYAGIEAEFKAGLNVNKQDEAKSEQRKGVVQKGKQMLADAIRGQVEVNASAGVGGEAGIGVDEDLRADTTTVYAHIGGHAEASAGAGPLGVGRGVAADRTIAITYDNKTGQIVGAEIQQRSNKYNWSGIRLAGGRVLGQEVAAKLGQNDAIVVTRQLTPAALERLQREGPKAMLSIDDAADTEVSGVQTVHTNNHNFGLGPIVQIDLGTRDVESVYSANPTREQKIYGLYDAMKSDGGSGTTIQTRKPEKKEEK